jgi:hypothetical protein
MRWQQLVDEQPRLAERARERLVEPGVVLVATIRRDGTPRVSPVEPFVLDGGLWLSMLWGSHKAADLVRDPRVLVHSVVTGRDGGDGEVKVRGRVRVEDDPGVQRAYADAVSTELGWSPVVGRFHLFEVIVEEVASLRYGERGDQHVALWPSGREFVRRGTSATSVGEPEPVHELLVAP